MNMCISAVLRFSQARQIFVRHSADPLVDVVEVDQKELSVAFKLLLVRFSFWLTISNFNFLLAITIKIVSINL